MTSAQIATQFQVTPEMISKTDRVIDCRRNKVFYQVESQSDATQDPYHVEFSDAHHVLTCTCAAGQNGLPNCWHRRAALAAEELRKSALRNRQQEQAEVERTEAYALEQAMIELERSQAELDAYLAEIDSRQAEAKRYYPAYKAGSQWMRFSSRGQDVQFETEQEAADYLRGVAGETRIETSRAEREVPISERGSLNGNRGFSLLK